MNKLVKATVTIMAISLVSKVLGFTRELVLGYIYGASVYSDIYIMSMNIPIIVFDLIGVAIATTFIPLYYENDKVGGESQALKFSNNIFNITLGLGVIISLICFLFAKPLVKLFAMGFEGSKLDLAVNFTRIMIFGGIFIGIRNIMTSLLQIKDNFLISSLTGLPFNIIIILSIILSSKYNIYILPIGTLIAIASQFIFQYPFAYKYGYKYKFIFDIEDKYVRKMIWLVSPVFIGVAVNQLNTIIDRSLASTLVDGSISALNYANKLNIFVTVLFITSISTAVYPMLSKLSSDNDKEQFSKIITKSVNSIIILVLPISVGAIVLSNPIVNILFERGAFDENATAMTSVALVFYSIGMVAFGLRDILGKIFYSLQDTKTPMINGVITVFFNIILNIVLVRFMKHAGLALATSLSSIICTILLFNSLSKKIDYFGQDKIIKTIIKSLLASAIMGIITYLGHNMISSILGNAFTMKLISLMVSILLGMVIYIIMATILKIDEIGIMINKVKCKLKGYFVLQNKIISNSKNEQ